MDRRKLLLIAYHFPPIQGSTGTTRSIAFSRYLDESDWDTCVLTISPGAYENISGENEKLIPSYVRVERAWGIDTRRTLSVFGRYPRFLALPDRWQSWVLGGYFRGLTVIKDWQPDVIMSTYPIATAHLIGFLLSRKFGLPWVAEFRDPMLQSNYPRNVQERWAFKKIEGLVFRNASRVLVTTDGCRQLYLDRYSQFDGNHISTISNGYDPTIFPDHKQSDLDEHNDRLVLLHSGLLYPHERNPTEFFKAISDLLTSRFFDQHHIEFRFRASGNEEQYCQMVDALGIAGVVRFLPRLSYQKAVEEMLSVDALMIFQADNCNDQIPAKVYEYLYAQKPILGFADPAGETGKFLSSVGINSTAKLENRSDIAVTVRSFVRDLESGEAFVVPQSEVRRYSRQSLTRDLARVLEKSLNKH